MSPPRRNMGYIPNNGKCQGRGCTRTLSTSRQPSKAGRWHIRYSNAGAQNDTLLCPECYKKSLRT